MQDMWKSAPFGAVSQLYRCPKEECKNVFRLAYIRSEFDCLKGFPDYAYCPACHWSICLAVVQGVPLGQAGWQAPQKRRSPKPRKAKAVGIRGDEPDNMVPKKKRSFDRKKYQREYMRKRRAKK